MKLPARLAVRGLSAMVLKSSPGSGVSMYLSEIGCRVFTSFLPKEQCSVFVVLMRD